MATWVRARGVGLGIAIGVITALVACGAPWTASHPSSTSNPASVLAAAVSKLQTQNGSTAKFRATISMGSVGEMDMAGVQQFTPSPALDVQVNLAGGQMSSALGSSMEIILKDGVEYLKFSGGMMSQLLRGKQWLKIDLNQVGSGAAGGGLGPALSVNQDTDPAQQIRLLLTSGNLKKVGTETVDGVSTTHYAGDVDPAKMLQTQSGSKLSQADIQKLQSSLQTAGITSQHIDLWLDKAGLPVRAKVSGQSAMGTVMVDEHFSDWGAPVSITAPPAGQVTDALTLAPAGGGP